MGVHNSHDDSACLLADGRIVGVLQGGLRALSVAQFTDATRAQYPVLAHVEGTIRLQVLEEGGGQLHQMLVAYEGLTDRVALINTSSNDCGKPITKTLTQARACAAVIGVGHICARVAVEDMHA